MHKIQSISQAIRILVLFAAMLNIVVWLFFAYTEGEQIIAGSASTTTASEGLNHDLATNTTAADKRPTELNIELKANLPEEQRHTLSSASLNPALWLPLAETLVTTLICWTLFAVFSQFQAGQLFTIQVVWQLKRLGLLLMLKPVIEVFYTNLLLLTIRLLGMVESVSLTFGFGSDDLKVFTVGLMVFAISWVMAEGLKLREEQELTI